MRSTYLYGILNERFSPHPLQMTKRRPVRPLPKNVNEAEISYPQKFGERRMSVSLILWLTKITSDMHIQLPNDSLSLRQPIHITSLTYLKNTTATSCHLATGTERGDVRRYDTRSAKRPVADWKGVAEIGGVKAIQTGSHEQYVRVLFGIGDVANLA